MKINSLVFTIALLFGIAVQTRADSPVTLSKKTLSTNQLEEIKTKAEKGDVKAQKKLGEVYLLGQGVPKDSTEAIKWYRRAAEQEDVIAADLLGDIYEHGVGVPSDHAEGVKWYHKAAERGDIRAQITLGELAQLGNGINTNGVEAIKWFHKAAEQNDAWAQFKLGEIYYKSFGVTKDTAEALKWLRKSAEQGNSSAQELLGWIYDTGDGVTKDSVEAAKWYRKAAEQDEPFAQNYLAVMCESGEGVPKNYAEAIKWYRKAAEQGELGAQSNLGLMYADGEGVPKDYVEAYKWLSLSAAQGNGYANKNLNIIEHRMSAEQVAEGQRLAREFKPRKEGSSNSASPVNPTVSGTGFFITDDGYLISNYHVVKGAAKVRVVTGAGTLEARVVQVDAANDLALLKADGRFAPLPIAASRKVQLGSTVATVGFPDPGLQGFSPKLAKGEIAALAGAADDARYFQVSVPVQPGNSGGALVDEHGNVVGIVSAKLDAATALASSGALPENVNYAVKSSFLLSFLESVPDVANKLKEPSTADRKFEDVVKSAQSAAVLVLVY